MDLYGGLIIRGRREGLGLARGNSGVALDEFSGNTTQGFNAEAERRDVQQQDVGLLSGENAGLHGCANRHDFVGVNAPVWFDTEDAFDNFLHFRNAGRASDQDDLVNLLDFRRII